MKRFLRILLFLLLMLGLTVPAMAEDLEADGFTYKVNEDGETVTITGSSSVPGGVLTIPAQLNDMTVTTIGQGAFYDCGAITDIVFPNTGTLTTIETNAFQSCDSLVSVTLPEGLTTLARESFGSCLLLREVHIPSTLTDAGSFYGPFTNSELLRTVTFADGLKTIPSHLFYGAWMESITLPESITAIQASAFASCPNLRSIVIPQGVTTIGYQAFMNCSALTEVSLPDSVETIADGAFQNVPLTSLRLPKGLLTIGDFAFSNCEGLTHVEIPEGVTTLGRESFGNIDTLKSVHIPSTLTDAGNFYGPFTGSANLQSVTFGEGTKTILSHLFYSASMESITLPESITAIEASAFTGCKNLCSIVIPEGVTTIGYQAFMNCSALTEVSLSDSVETIAGGAFQNAPLTNLRLSKGLLTIGDYAFSNCEGLTHVVIPEGVTTLGRESFGNIDTLKSVHIPSTLTDAGNAYGPFTGSANLQSVTFGEGTKTIPSHLFYSAAMESITLPDTLVTIGSEAFRYCENLTSIVLPLSVTTVETGAFRDCPALTTAVLSPSLSKFGKSTFYNCGALYQIGIPEGIAEIPDSTFQNCTSLESFWLPNSMRTLGVNAFRGCTALNEVKIRNGLTTIGDSAFRDCTELAHIDLPLTVTDVKGSAFRDDNKLKSVMFFGDAPQISTDHAFPDCTTLYYPAERENWTTPFYPTATKYPTCAVWGTVPLNDPSYFSKLDDHHFKFRDYAGNALTDVTVVFGEELHSSGEAAEITARFANDAVTELTFRKEGYFSVTLPIEVLEGISVIRMYPDSWDEPFVQAAYARDINDGAVYDLINGGMLLTAGDRETTYELYIQPNWLDMPQQYFVMSTSLEIEDTVAYLFSGWHEPVALAESLELDDKLYILQGYGDGTIQTVTPVQTVITEEDLELTLELGDAFDIPFISDDLIEFFGQTSGKIDLNNKWSIQLQLESDGSFTIVVGASFEKKEEAKQYGNTLKEQLEKQADNFTNGTGNLADMLEKQTIDLRDYDAVPATTFGKLVFKPEFQILGTVEGKLTLNELGKLKPYITEGIVAGQFKGSFARHYPFFQPGQYFSLSFNTEHQILLRIPNGFLDGATTPISSEYEGKIISIVPRYGLGYDGVLSAGLRGEGAVNINCSFPIRKDATSLYLSAAIYAEAAVFALEADYELVNIPEIPLYTGSEAAQLLSDVMSVSLKEDSDWKPQSMDYLYQIPLLDVGEDNTDTDVTVLDSGVYPYAETQLAVLPDGTELAVWVEHGDQEPNNRTRLYYSYTVDGSWSEPTPVNGEDTTADFSPVLQVENGRAYLLWQDASRALTADDDVTAMASVMDVSVACFNGEGFDLLGTFGTEFYDGAMSLTTLNGQVTVYWASNGDNDVFFGGGLTSALHRALWNGEEWIPETLVQNTGAIDRTSAWDGKVWFTADAAGNGIPTDRELFCYDGKLNRLTEDDVIDSKPAAGAGSLMWFRDGTLTDGEVEIPMAYVTDRYRYLQNGAMEALVYVVNDSQQQSNIYASFNDGTGWGEAIALTDGKTNIGSFDVCFLPDGSLAVLTLERSAYLSEDQQISYSAGVLNRYAIRIRGDVALEEASYVSTTLQPNNDLAVRLMLTNRGMVYANALQVTVSDGKTLLAQQACMADLASGESGAVTVNVPLGETIPEELTVTVTPIGFADEQTEDNTAYLTLNCTDLSLDEAVAVSGSGTTVTVMVTNRGQTDIETAELTLTDKDGLVLATQTVTGLESRSAKFVEFTLSETLEHNALLIVKAPQIGTENLISNNKIAVPVQNTSVGSFTEALSISVQKNGVKVSVVLSNTTGDDLTGNYICAAYDGNGKMLDCFTGLSHTTPSGKTTFLSDSFPLETEVVRLFRLDDQLAPKDIVMEKQISR